MSNNNASSSNATKVQNARYVIEINVQPNETADPDEMDSSVGVCGYHHFAPAGRNLRSRVDSRHLLKHDISLELKAFFERVRVIPGECVWVDLTKGEWGTYDPLYKPEEGTPLQRQSEKIIDLMAEFFTGGQRVKFIKPVTNQLAGPSDAKNILYWMARAAKAKYASVPTGEPALPSIDSIKAMPGKRRVDYGTSTSDPQTKEILSQYEHEVPVGAGSK